MHGPPTISIIIPTYNRAQYLPDALQSCRDQTFQDFEIIVVDDGSTDSTSALIKEYPEVRYFYQPNGGVSNARNHGLRHARGEFIQFLDSDDVLLPHKLERSLEEFKNYPETDLVYSRMEMRSDDLQQIYFPNGQTDMGRTVTLKDLLLGGTSFFGPSSILVRCKALIDVGCFDDKLRAAEDWHLIVKLLAAGKSFRSVDEALVWHRNTPNRLTNDRLNLRLYHLLAYERVRPLIPPGVVDIDEQLATRTHIVAMRYWEQHHVRMARTYLCRAIRLHPKGRQARRLLLVLSYFTPYETANMLVNLLMRHRHKPASA